VQRSNVDAADCAPLSSPIVQARRLWRCRRGQINRYTAGEASGQHGQDGKSQCGADRAALPGVRGDALHQWDPPTSFRFTGQRHNGYVNLYFMGARQHDPYIARWLSADGIVPSPSNPQSLNRYSYVLGDPLGYVDPSGHHECSPTGACTDDPETPGATHEPGPQGTPLPIAGLPPGPSPVPTPTGYDSEESIHQAYGLIPAWLSNNCPNPWVVGLDSSLTQDVMYDRGMQAFYKAWAAAGYTLPFSYQDTADVRHEGSFLVRFVPGMLVLAREHLWEPLVTASGFGSKTAQGPVDAVGGTVGSLDVIYATDAGDKVLITVQTQ